MSLRFLRREAYDPFAGVFWSADDWIAPPSGVVAYASADLPRWISNELWRVELEGPTSARDFSVVAARGRLAERVTAWDMTVAAEFVGWLVSRHPSMGYVPTTDAWTPAWEAAYVAAHTAGMDAAEAGDDYAEAERGEWNAQSRWLGQRLNLA